MYSGVSIIRVEYFRAHTSSRSVTHISAGRGKTTERAAGDFPPNIADFRPQSSPESLIAPFWYVGEIETMARLDGEL